MYANHISDYGLVSRINKEFLLLNDKRALTQLKTGGRIQTDISPKKIYKRPTSKDTLIEKKREKRYTVRETERGRER